MDKGKAQKYLKGLADKLQGNRYEWDISVSGASHLSLFTASVRVYDGNDVLRYHGEGAAASTKQGAKEEAAKAAVSAAGHVLPDSADTDKAAVRRQAWLGDAAQEFVLGLLGTRAGLTAAQMDDLSQSLLCNKALAEDAPEQLASETLTATHVEARLGLRLAQHLDSLLEILLPALIDANPALHDKLQAGVAAAAA